MTDGRYRWHQEPGARIEASRPLDSSKIQAPGVVRLPDGGFRLFYTAVGPGRPFATCQGYILSAVSEDGLRFTREDGIRLLPQPTIPYLSRRALAPSVTRLTDGNWRMYFEARGPATRPTVICSATSSDLLRWELDDGIRIEGPADVGGPRYLALPDGRGRIYCFSRADRSVVSAITSDGLAFAFEPGDRLRGGTSPEESAGITAAEAILPEQPGEPWTMYYSSWQDVPAGTVVPPHPSSDPGAEAAGVDFAKASIAADMAGYRSRIYRATSRDGLTWERAGVVVQGYGYGTPGIDAVHAEDMAVVRLDDDRHRMYYAACDTFGNWRIASAVTER